MESEKIFEKENDKLLFNAENNKRGQPLTLTPNLHMNLPYSFTILCVVLWLLLIICIT